MDGLAKTVMGYVDLEGRSKLRFSFAYKVTPCGDAIFIYVEGVKTANLVQSVVEKIMHISRPWG